MSAKAIALAMMAVLLIGCTTPYAEDQRKLFWKWQRGVYTEDQYQQKLKELKSEQPWGGMHGASEEPPPPIVIGDGDDMHNWYLRSMDYIGSARQSANNP